MSKEPRAFVPKTASDLQKMKLDRLMQNPDKPVLIPERPKEKSNCHVPEFVRNVMGSSAGAGSGEFHVYRHLRRKEYTRQKMIDQRSEKERLDDEYREKLEENKRKMEEKTAKKRAKRLKRKEKLKIKKKMKASKPAEKHSSSESSEEISENEDNKEEQSDDSSSNLRTETVELETESRDSSSLDRVANEEAVLESEKETSNPEMNLPDNR